MDPSKATFARPRKLGLRPQTVRVRPAGRFLRPRRVPRKFIGTLRGHAGFGYRPVHLPFQKPLHPVNRSVHQHAEAFTTDAITPSGRHGRARFDGRGEVLLYPMNIVISTSPACLRGPVNRGAEKMASLILSFLTTVNSCMLHNCFGDEFFDIVHDRSCLHINL